MDYAALLYYPIYETEGVAATITLNDMGATEIELTALYVPSGKAVGTGRSGAQLVDVGTVKMAACVRRSELTALASLEQLDGATITLNSETWKIKSWIPFPAPTGEAAGELRLILAETL